MIYKFFQPAPALQEFVKEYLLLHFKFNDRSVNPTKTYTPRPEQCLTFDPKGHVTSVNLETGEVQQRSYSYFSSQQSTCYQLYFDSDYLMLKVIFQPGALYKLLGIPLHQFSGYVDAATVLNKEMRLINEQLANAADYIKMLQIVEDYLISKVRVIKKPDQPIDKIKNILINQPEQFSLQWFAHQACLSPRQFERKFLERIGVSPKLYSRIARFHRAFEMKAKNPGMDWLAVATACGYTDFQHLNKDFKQFAGTTPTALIKNQTLSVEKMLKLI